MKTTHSEAQQWWSNLSNGERRLVCSIARLLEAPKPKAKLTTTATPALPSPRPTGRGIKGEGESIRQPVPSHSSTTVTHRKPSPRTLLKELIRAAAHWENGIGCFVKVRIIHQRPFRLAPNSAWLRIEGKPDHDRVRKQTANPVPIPIRWSEGYLPRRRNLCRQKRPF